MAAPRATQWIALRNLAKAGSQQQVRHLHMTGPATYSSPVLIQERPATNLPSDMAGLRAECRRRKIDTRGNKQELQARLSADEITSSRAFSTAAAAAKRPSATADQTSNNAPATRHFNTSRTLKAVNDSSTLDFAFLPSAEAIDEAEMAIRVPIMPDNYTPPRHGAHAPIAEEAVVLRPEVSTMSADSTFAPLAESHDDHAINVDFHAMADAVAKKVQTMGVPMQQRAGLMKQIWGDMVDDVMGIKKAVA